MIASSVVGTDNSNSQVYANSEDVATSNAESGDASTVEVEVSKLINHASKGSGPFEGVAGFESGLTADEQQLLDEAENLKAQGFDDAALYLEIKVAQSIDARFATAAGGEVTDVNYGLQTTDKQDFTAFLDSAETAAKTGFFQSLPELAESMPTEEFFLFIANVASVAGPDSGLLDADAYEELQGHLASYNHNIKAENPDQAANALLSIGFLIKSELPGAAPVGVSSDPAALTLGEETGFKLDASFDDLIMENARVAKIWIKEQLAAIIGTMSGSEKDKVIEQALMDNAMMSERVNDLYSIWTTAFQMAVK